MCSGVGFYRVWVLRLNGIRVTHTLCVDYSACLGYLQV